MKQRLKKIALVSGIAILGLVGIRSAFDNASDEDVGKNVEDVSAKIEYARNVLAEVEEELKSDTLSAGERHELILTRTEIQNEIEEYLRQASKQANKKAIITPAQHEK